ncbi:competence protein CoiA family protein [Clostridium botulinum]|uniref:competence protein CoiA family protein n=1 Tax=Clostridium botulinum TaxID=1491 RepID=UPI001C9ABA27|nr:competence protein CoiA family protein [Clostridium botulinum]MBY6838817.1 hypothetical protein [Clostridium botulinum]
MGFENINLWFAKDSNNKTVLAKDITKNIKHKNYICPICNSCVIPKTGDVMTWHFAHKDASKCNSETMIHWWVKNELIKIGDKFKVNIEGKITEYVCKELKIEQKYETSKGIYKPDITIITTNDEIIYVEIEHTNKKKLKDFINIWEELNHTVVEVETRDIINGNKIEYMKAIWYEGKEYYEQLKKLRSVCDKEKEKYKFTKKQVDKIDWLISEMCKYNQGRININQLSNEIQAIENEDERELVCNIIRNKQCGTVLDDYVGYNKNKVEKKLKTYNEDYKFECNITRFIYDRIFCGCDIEMFYKNHYCGKGFCNYNFESFENVLNSNFNKCKILYGKLKDLILKNLPRCTNVKYLNNSYGESIYFINTYIKLENESIAYNTVNSLIRTELDKTMIFNKKLKTFKENKIWLNEIENINFKYSEKDDIIYIYRSSGSVLMSIDNKTMTNLEITNIKEKITDILNKVELCEDLRNKLKLIIQKLNDEFLKFSYPVVNIDVNNYRYFNVSVDLYNRDIYNERIFEKKYEVNECNLKTILKEVEDIVNKTKERCKYIYDVLNEFKIKNKDVKNEYEIEILSSYCLVYNLYLENVELLIRYTDVKDVKKLLKRKIFKKCLIENFNVYYELTIVKEVIHEINIKYRKYVKGTWNFLCKDEKLYINGKEKFKVDYSLLNSKEKLKSYLDMKISNSIRAMKYRG